MKLNFLKNKIFYLILFLIILRIFLVTLSFNNIPDSNIDPSLWTRSTGGDKGGYFNSAQALLGEDKKLSWPVGFPLLLIPFIKIFNAQEVVDIIKPVVFVHSIIFYSLVIILVYFLAKKILQNKIKSVIIAFFFLIYPYLFYFFFSSFVQQNEIITPFFIDRFNQLMFLEVLSDPLSILMAVSSLLIILYLLKDKIDSVAAKFIFLGFIVSYAVLTRWQNAILVPIYSLILLGYCRFKSFFYFILGGLFLGIWQLYLNYQNYGSIFKTTYGLYMGPEGDIPMISLYYPLRIFTYPMRYSPFLLLPVILGFILVIAGIKEIIKRNKRVGLITTTYLILYVLMLVFLEPSLRNPRYFLPVIPLIFIFVFVGFEKFIILIKNYDGKTNKI